MHIAHTHTHNTHAYTHTHNTHTHIHTHTHTDTCVPTHIHTDTCAHSHKTAVYSVRWLHPTSSPVVSGPELYMVSSCMKVFAHQFSKPSFKMVGYRKSGSESTYHGTRSNCRQLTGFVPRSFQCKREWSGN